MGVLVWSVTSFLIFLVVSSATSKQDDKCSSCVHKSSVAVFPKYTDFSKGTCQYGKDEMELGNVHLAAATSTLYYKGIGCGAFYQVKCTNTSVCKPDGIKVIVFTEHKSASNNPAFRLTEEAFNSMFYKPTNKDSIGVLYKRVPSVFVGNKKSGPPSLSIRVEEVTGDSLEIKILYQGGQTNLVMVEVMMAKPPKGDPVTWIRMTQKIGVVWQVSSLSTKRHLKFKFSVRQWYKTVSYESLTYLNVSTRGNVINLGFQLSETASEDCKSCVYTWS